MLSNLKNLASSATGISSAEDAFNMASRAGAGAMTLAKSAFRGTYDVGGVSIHIGQQLAEGGYSYVHLAEEVGTGRRFALKRVVMNGMEANKNARHELQVLKALQGHRNIMQLYGHANLRVKRDGMTELLLLCELCEEGHLYDYYKAHGEHIAEDKLFELFVQCCEGVGHMHARSPPLAHRDVKIENFLVQRGVVKLCDFGSATARAKAYTNRKEILDEEENISKYSTMMYRAPEMVDLYSGKIVDHRVDIWALGCVLYTLAFGKHPFGEAGTLHIISGKYTVPTGKYSNKLDDTLAYMIVPDVQNRPSCADAVEFIRSGKKRVRKHGPPTSSAAKTGAAPSRNDDFANFDDFDPRDGAATSSRPAAGGLFEQLDWQAEAQPPPAAQTTNGADAGSFAAFDDDFDPFGNRADAAPKVATSSSPRKPSQSNALFGQLDWKTDAQERAEEDAAWASKGWDSPGNENNSSAGAFLEGGAPEPAPTVGLTQGDGTASYDAYEYGDFGGVSLQDAVGDLDDMDDQPPIAGDFVQESAAAVRSSASPSPAHAGASGNQLFGQLDWTATNSSANGTAADLPVQVPTRAPAPQHSTEELDDIFGGTSSRTPSSTVFDPFGHASAGGPAPAQGLAPAPAPAPARVNSPTGFDDLFSVSASSASTNHSTMLRPASSAPQPNLQPMSSYSSSGSMTPMASIPTSSSFGSLQPRGQTGSLTSSTELPPGFGGSLGSFGKPTSNSAANLTTQPMVPLARPAAAARTVPTKQDVFGGLKWS